MNGAIKEWERMLKEEGEANMWASIGVSAILTALVLNVIVKVIIKK